MSLSSITGNGQDMRRIIERLESRIVDLERSQRAVPARLPSGANLPFLYAQNEIKETITAAGTRTTSKDKSITWLAITDGGGGGGGTYSASLGYIAPSSGGSPTTQLFDYRIGGGGGGGATTIIGIRNRLCPGFNVISVGAGGTAGTTATADGGIGGLTEVRLATNDAPSTYSYIIKNISGGRGGGAGNSSGNNGSTGGRGGWGAQLPRPYHPAIFYVLSIPGEAGATGQCANGVLTFTLARGGSPGLIIVDTGFPAGIGGTSGGGATVSGTAGTKGAVFWFED